MASNVFLFVVVYVLAQAIGEKNSGGEGTYTFDDDGGDDGGGGGGSAEATGNIDSGGGEGDGNSETVPIVLGVVGGLVFIGAAVVGTLCFIHGRAHPDTRGPNQRLGGSTFSEPTFANPTYEQPSSMAPQTSTYGDTSC